VEQAVRLIQGLVDVISSNGWLNPVMVAMELSQMVVQALTPTQSPMKQLPHFTNQLIEKAKAVNVEDIFDLMNMEDADRIQLLDGLTQSELHDVAAVCNRYPVITLEYKVDTDGDTVPRGESVKVAVTLERDIQDESLGPVYSPYYPKEKEEQWWLVIGQPETNHLLAIKRLTVQKNVSNLKLEFNAPEREGQHEYVLYLMSDCYMGCDQEYKFSLSVV